MEQGAERFIAQWTAAEKVRAGLRHPVVCQNVTVRTKDTKAQIKSARDGSLVIIITHKCWRELVPSERMSCCCLSLASRLVCFLFSSFLLLSKPRFFVQSFLGMHAPRQSSTVNCLCPILSCFLGDVSFSEYSASLPFTLCVKSTLYVFLPDGVFLSCDHGLDFDISLLCESSIKNQSICTESIGGTVEEKKRFRTIFIIL